MNPPMPLSSSLVASRAEHIFPKLTPAQMARVAQHGRPRKIEAGEVLFEAGPPVSAFFLVKSGRIQ